MSELNNQSSNDCQTALPNVADPNIAGPGIIIGFILTGVLTFLASYTALYLQKLASRESGPNGLLKRFTPRHAVEDPTQFWIRTLNSFILQLSDQQLMTGLLLLICGYIKYWQSSVLDGANSLWTVTDVVCYSSFTHAATLLSLRPYFQQHRKFATFRVVIMYIIYILWLLVAVYILEPDKPKSSHKLPSIASKFWHAATIIEAIGIMWIYLVTYLLVFLSKDTATVRDMISRGSPSVQDLEHIQDWVNRITSTISDTKIKTRSWSWWWWWQKYSPYTLLRRCIIKCMILFSTEYATTTSQWERWLLRCLAELILPWRTAAIWLGFLWAFSLGALIYSLMESGLASSWDFGQLLPVVMVLLPFQSLFTVIIGD